MKWKARLQRAEQRGKFYEDDRIQARDWSTCAISEHIKKAIKKDLLVAWRWNTAQRILTPNAYDLGRAFCCAIESDHVEEAKEIFEQINKTTKFIKNTKNFRQ